MLSRPGGDPCITGFQQEKEEEKSSSSLSLDVTAAGGSCSANSVMFLGRTVEGLQDSPPAATCPMAREGPDGGRQQLLEGSVSPFSFEGEKQELGIVQHILQAHLQLLKGG